jgi:hypothetical protein
VNAECSIMKTLREYREFAEQCDCLAQQAKTDNQRNTLKKIAKAWREVADQDDESVSQPASPTPSS